MSRIALIQAGVVANVIEAELEFAQALGYDHAQEAGDAEKVKTYASLLYNQALLVEGMPLEDPVAFANAVASLMK